MAGPGELAIVGLRFNADRRRFEYLLPEAGDTGCRAVPCRAAGLTDIDHAPADPIGASRGKSGFMSTGQRVSSCKAIPQPADERLLQDRSLHTAHVSQESTILKTGAQGRHEFKSGVRWNCEHHQFCLSGSSSRTISQLCDSGSLECLDCLRSLGRVADNPRHAGEAGLPGKRAADRTQADYP
jgi:hypothetical protein